MYFNKRCLILVLEFEVILALEQEIILVLELEVIIVLEQQVILVLELELILVLEQQVILVLELEQSSSGSASNATQSAMLN